MGKPLDSPASFRSISLTSSVSKLFERIILSRVLFFSGTLLHSLSPSDRFPPRRSTSHQILHPSQSISNGFNKPRPGSRTILSTIDFSKASSLSGIPPFSINSFWLAFLLALLVGLNFFFLLACLRSFFKITKVAPFESVKLFRNDPFLAVDFSFSSSMIFLLLYLLPSAALFTLII